MPTGDDAVKPAAEMTRPERNTVTAALRTAYAEWQADGAADLFALSIRLNTAAAQGLRCERENRDCA